MMQKYLLFCHSNLQFISDAVQIILVDIKK